MKTFLLMLVLAISTLVADKTFAQAPVPPAAPSNTLTALQDQNEKLGTQLQLLYERLHGLTEFQQYLQVRAAYEQNQAALAQAQQAPKAPVAPAKPAVK